MLFSIAKSSHIASILLIASAAGAMRTISSAYASAPVKIPPMLHPIPARDSLHNKPSKYTQNKTGLSTPPCFTPFKARKDGLLAPDHETNT